MVRAMDPVLYGPGEGEHHDAGPAQIFIKATGEHTAGSFFLAESVLAPGFAGPPPHRHRELHDMFYVLEGTLTLRLGERTIEAGPGSFACVPPGVVHTFRNDSDGPVRVLNFNTPAGGRTTCAMSPRRRSPGRSRPRYSRASRHATTSTSSPNGVALSLRGTGAVSACSRAWRAQPSTKRKQQRAVG
jgi:quercetin dioxygenase-like cupin family protein